MKYVQVNGIMLNKLPSNWVKLSHEGEQICLLHCQNDAEACEIFNESKEIFQNNHYWVGLYESTIVTTFKALEELFDTTVKDEVVTNEVKAKSYQVWREWNYAKVNQAKEVSVKEIIANEDFSKKDDTKIIEDIDGTYEYLGAVKGTSKLKACCVTKGLQFDELMLIDSKIHYILWLVDSEDENILSAYGCTEKRANQLKTMLLETAKANHLPLTVRQENEILAVPREQLVKIYGEPSEVQLNNMFHSRGLADLHAEQRKKVVSVLSAKLMDDEITKVLEASAAIEKEKEKLMQQFYSTSTEWTRLSYYSPQSQQSAKKEISQEWGSEDQKRRRLS